MGIPAGAQAASIRASQSGTGHHVMCFKVLAFCEAVLPNSLTSKVKARIVGGRDDVLLGYFRGRVAQPSQWQWVSVGSVRLFFGGHLSRRDVGLLPRLHGTSALSMVMVSAGFL